MDNGDGTLTMTISNRGNSKWSGSDGKLLFVTAGNFTFQITVDHGGTPPTLGRRGDRGSFTVVKETGVDKTAGRDFCEDLLFFTSCRRS